MSGRSWVKVLISLVLLSTATFILLDIRSSGSFKKSQTNRALRNAGVLPYFEKGIARVTYYSDQTSAWLTKNGPLYAKAVSDTCKPYLEIFWLYVGEVGLVLWRWTEVPRSVINTYVPPILEKVTDVYIPTLLGKLDAFVKYLSAHASVVWSLILEYLILLGDWLKQNVFTGSLSPENLQKSTAKALENVQQYYVAGYKWLSNHVNALIK